MFLDEAREIDETDQIGDASGLSLNFELVGDGEGVVGVV